MLWQTEKISNIDQSNEDQENKFENYIPGMYFSTLELLFEND